MINVWLDDYRQMPPEYDIHVKNYDEAVAVINQYGAEIQIMSFDHDLADIHYGCTLEEDYKKMVEKTGYDILLWIVGRKMDGLPVPLEYRVHSANPVGAERMRAVIERYLK